MGRNGVYQVPSRLPRGQQLAQGTAWRGFSQKGGRPPTYWPTDSHSGEPRVEHIKLTRAAIKALTLAALPSFQTCGWEWSWRLEAGFQS